MATYAPQDHRADANPPVNPSPGSQPDTPSGHLPARLTGCPLPALEAPATGSFARISMSGLDRAVLYFYPGSPYSPEDSYDSSALDEAQHRAFADHWSDFLALNCLPVGVSSQPRDQQRVVADTLGFRQPLVCDDELLLARELGLPTFAIGDTDWYCRATLVVRDGLVVQAFYPITSAIRSPALTIEWIRSQRWS